MTLSGGVRTAGGCWRTIGGGRGIVATAGIAVPLTIYCLFRGRSSISPECSMSSLIALGDWPGGAGKVESCGDPSEVDSIVEGVASSV